MADTHGLAGLQTTLYFNVAALALLTFDYCITLEAEVCWIWGRKWDVTRVTFMLSRYMPFVGGAMTCYAALASRVGENCNSFGNASNGIHIISIISAEGLLIIRTYAFWQRDRRILVALTIFALLCITAAFTMTMLVQIALPDDQSPLVYTGSCTFEVGRNRVLQIVFLMLFETVLLGLTMYKRRTYYRDSNGSLITTLYRDGMGYMGLVLLLSAVIIIVELSLPSAYSEMMDTPQLVVHSVLASRVLFNLRESDRRAHMETLSTNVSTFRATLRVPGTRESTSSSSSTDSDRRWFRGRS